MHFVSDLFKQLLPGPRLCIPSEKNAQNAYARFIGNAYLFHIICITTDGRVGAGVVVKRPPDG